LEALAYSVPLSVDSDYLLVVRCCTLSSYNVLLRMKFVSTVGQLLAIAAAAQASVLAVQDSAPQAFLQGPSTEKKHHHCTHLKGPLFTLHRNLIEIESISQNEHDVGIWLAKYLKRLDLTVDIIPLDSQVKPTKHKSKPEPKRFNLHAYIGKNSSTRALFSSHIDTVPPFWPYQVRANGTEIWGRGSVDAKASVAAQIIAFQELRAAKQLKEGDVGLLFVVGEEIGGDGMRAANALDLTWEAVVFGEPTEGKLAAGHKGNMGFTIKAQGKAAHSGYPWLGLSANDLMVPALTALEGLKGKLPKSEKYGESTLNIGRIEGGVAANVVAETSEAKIAVRIADGPPADIKELVVSAVTNATAGLIGSDGKVEIVFNGEGYGPVDIDHDIEGFDTITVNYGTDIPNLYGKHKKYLYGPGSILVAHSDHEHIKVEELTTAVKDYKKIMTAVLKR